LGGENIDEAYRTTINKLIHGENLAQVISEESELLLKIAIGQIDLRNHMLHRIISGQCVSPNKKII
jgi:hypothetical protein